MLIYNLDPKDNPEYVQSELDAARMELTDSEYASEFEGKIVSAEGAKYPYVEARHLQYVPRQYFKQAKYILGIDQGPRNFGACLLAWDENLMVPCYEFFDSSERTMGANLKHLLKRVPHWITSLGGNVQDWMLTVTDKEPSVRGIITEMAAEGMPWPTEVEERHKNNRKIGDNWRRECQEFINEMAHKNKLIFHQSEIVTTYSETESAGAVLLHDQVLQVVDKPEIASKESDGASLDKGWIVNDWRGDHVLDSWLFATWAVLSEQVPEMVTAVVPDMTPIEEQRKAQRFLIAETEMRELGITQSSEQVFESIFGRKRNSRGGLGRPGYYSNES